jgi:hypothetical protein
LIFKFQVIRNGYSRKSLAGVIWQVSNKIVILASESSMANFNLAFEHLASLESFASLESTARVG